MYNIIANNRCIRTVTGKLCMHAHRESVGGGPLCGEGDGLQTTLFAHFSPSMSGALRIGHVGASLLSTSSAIVDDICQPLVRYSLLHLHWYIDSFGTSSKLSISLTKSDQCVCGGGDLCICCCCLCDTHSHTQAHARKDCSGDLSSSVLFSNWRPPTLRLICESNVYTKLVLTSSLARLPTGEWVWHDMLSSNLCCSSLAPVIAFRPWPSALSHLPDIARSHFGDCSDCVRPSGGKYWIVIGLGHSRHTNSLLMRL